MMRLSIVKYENNEECQAYNEDSLPHGTKALKEIMMPWANTESIVCAESYFASVPNA